LEMFLSTVSGIKGSEVTKYTLSNQHTLKGVPIHNSCRIWYLTLTQRTDLRDVYNLIYLTPTLV
jgi:hypothetical protein